MISYLTYSKIQVMFIQKWLISDQDKAAVFLKPPRKDYGIYNRPSIATSRISKRQKRRPGPMEHPELPIGEDAVYGWTLSNKLTSSLIPYNNTQVSHH